MLRFPEEHLNAIRLADWLELRAVESADHNSSINELSSPLRIIGVSDGEQVMIETLREIEQRVSIAGASYPFRLRAGVMYLKPNSSRYAAYLFCLGLSYFGWTARRYAVINPWYLFEDLACIAAQQYLQGEVFSFGARSHKSNRSFRTAIQNLCKAMGEGIDIRPDIPKELRPKDDKIDLVAWKHFTDKKPSKVIMFGQCAAGADWKQKVTHAQPEAFWSNWLIEGPISPRIRSFFIPHRIHNDTWNYFARYAGVLFDRCRISYWAFQKNADVLRMPEFYLWFDSTLNANIRRQRVIRRRHA